MLDVLVEGVKLLRDLLDWLPLQDVVQPAKENNSQLLQHKVSSVEVPSGGGGEGGRGGGGGGGLIS